MSLTYAFTNAREILNRIKYINIEEFLRKENIHTFKKKKLEIQYHK